MSNYKRVLFFVKSMYGGGAQRVIINLATGFKKKGLDVGVVSLYDRCDYEIGFPVSMFPLNVSETNKSINDNVVAANNIAEKLQVTNSDILVVCSSSATLYEYAIYFFEKAKSKPALIAALTNEPTMSPSKKADQEKRDEMFHKVYELGGRFVFQTQSARDYFGEDIAEKSMIINNPISPDLPEPFCGKRQRKIVSVGRLNFQKNYPLLIASFKRFLKTHADYILEIYGEGEEREKLQSIIGQETRIKLVGFTNDLYNRINNAMAFIMTSDFEGVSNAMLEALSLGIPTIVTDCPAYGARMFIDNYENGIIIPLNDENAVVKALSDVVDSADLRGKMSQKSVEIRRLLSVEHICDQYIELIEGN